MLFDSTLKLLLLLQPSVLWLSIVTFDNDIKQKRAFSMVEECRVTSLPCP